MSKTSYEFVVHIPEEYDYRYSSVDKRDKILECIAQAANLANKDKLMAFYFKVFRFWAFQEELDTLMQEDPNLSQYVTTKSDKKKGISKIPKDKAVYFNADSLKVNIDSSVWKITFA